jgi:hypothetical protein
MVLLSNQKHQKECGLYIQYYKLVQTRFILQLGYETAYLLREKCPSYREWMV